MWFVGKLRDLYAAAIRLPLLSRADLLIDVCANSAQLDSVRQAGVSQRHRARSSAGEHRLHTAGVTGSNPVAPTNFLFKFHIIRGN